MLTFDKSVRSAYNVNNKNFQGVYFMWGSLVGISPVGTTVSSVRIYIPLIASGGWEASTVGSSSTPWSGSGWGSIPYVTSASSTYAKTENYLYDLSNSTSYVAYKGDICTYLTDGSWRMPNASEFGSGSYSSKSSGNSSGANEAGTGLITVGYTGTFGSGAVFFPASGFRWYNNGNLDAVANYMDYWSGSAQDIDCGYVIQNSEVARFYRGFGSAVRCIKR
jgi:hypothetical protein